MRHDTTNHFGMAFFKAAVSMAECPTFALANAPQYAQRMQSNGKSEDHHYAFFRFRCLRAAFPKVRRVGLVGFPDLCIQYSETRSEQ